MRNALLVVLCGLLLLIGLSRRPHPLSSPARPSATPIAHARPVSLSGAPATTIAPAPSTLGSSLDLVERLAERRRIEREGDRVYLDSLFPHTDSVLPRWVDKRALTVTLEADTIVPGWSRNMQDEARAAMRVWDGNGSGISFQEVAAGATSDIVVQWVATLPDPGQVGNTRLDWDADGVAHHATILLALHRNTDSLPVPATDRVRIAAHEFGHALGLPHSADPGDIMFRTSPIGNPSARDQATLRLLYTLTPGSLRVHP